ncbi:MAG TPA: arginyltransferase [Gemmataceae bacterium]|nr:arginyltransferase [Gemmataceae bacterium]
MELLARFVCPPSACGYLPDRLWQLEYEFVRAMTAGEYAERMANGWRRFGRSLFHPVCPHCQACRTLRVLVEQFRPNRSQRRARKLNEGVVRLKIGKPSASREKLELYDCYHDFQSEFKGWREHAPKEMTEYIQSFVDNPFPVQEWCFYLEKRLIGVGYVDNLPGAMSAIYFYYDPNERHRSLGTWNVLSMIEVAAMRGIPHVYLGYYVEGCASLEYKANFAPNQVREPNGDWRDFRI